MWWGSDTLVPRSSPLGDSARLYLRYCISAGTSAGVRASGVSTFGETKELTLVPALITIYIALPSPLAANSGTRVQKSWARFIQGALVVALPFRNWSGGLMGIDP